jgi:hypothetical protein
MYPLWYIKAKITGVESGPGCDSLFQVDGFFSPLVWPWLNNNLWRTLQNLALLGKTVSIWYAVWYSLVILVSTCGEPQILVSHALNRWTSDNTLQCTVVLVMMLSSLSILNILLIYDIFNLWWAYWDVTLLDSHIRKLKRSLKQSTFTS